MAEAMPERVARRATRGFVALTAGRALSLVVQFVAFAITAATLGPSELGIYTFAVAFIGLFRFVTNFGFRGVVARDVAQHPEREDELVANLAWLRFGLGVLAWAIVVAAVYLAGFEPDQRNAAIVTGALLLFLAFESFEITLEVRLRTGWVAIAEIVKSCILASGALVLASQGRGVTAFLVLYVLANLIRLVLPTVVAIRSRRYSWRPKTTVWFGIARAAAYLGLAQLCIALYYRLDMLLLARFKPAADVGQYGAAYQFLETFVVLPGLAMVVLTPIISRSFVEGGDVLRRRLRHLLHLTALVALPVAVAGMMTAWRVVPALPGFSEFEGAGVALSVLSPSTLAIFLGTVLSGVLIAAHKQRVLFWSSFAGLGLNLVLNGALIPPFSYVGAGVATSVTELALVAVELVLLAKLLDLHWPLSDAARAARASVVLALVLVPGMWLNPFLQVAIGVVAYLLVILPTGSFRWADLGGLVASGGPEVHVVASGASGPDGAVTPKGLIGTTKALMGAGGCQLHLPPDGRAPVWLPAAARAAGCSPVTVAGGPYQGRLRRRVWPLFVDPAADQPTVSP